MRLRFNNADRRSVRLLHDADRECVRLLNDADVGRWSVRLLNNDDADEGSVRLRCTMLWLWLNDDGRGSVRLWCNILTLWFDMLKLLFNIWLVKGKDVVFNAETVT